MTRSRWTLALFVAGAALTSATARPAASGAPQDPADNGPQTWTFDAHQKVMPLAELSHFRHASSQGLKIPCTRCHHTSKGTDVEAGCGDCHGAAWSPDVPDIKSATHGLCVRCHVQNNASPAARPAPYKCRGCHTGTPPAR
jgi:predicted CXXCH cytochrome family protein